MKYLVKKSVLLLLVVLAFCACDNSNDNGEVIQPNPHPQSSKTVVNYTGEVEFVVDAPQIREDIEQDLKANPPFGGSKKYQFIIKSHSTLSPLYMLTHFLCLLLEYTIVIHMSIYLLPLFLCVQM